jgi:outer membrane protein assembly factor BamB
MSLDEETLYVATAEGEVVALRARTGAEIWRQGVLLHRGLSAPADMSDAIVVGDFQGYVHWLDKASGALMARTKAGGARISNAPLVIGNVVLVQTDRGQISAYRVTALGGAAARKAAAAAPLPAAPAPAAPTPSPEAAPAPAPAPETPEGK